MPQTKMPTPVLLILTLAPALLIGATFWIAGNLVPACAIFEHQRLPSPDARFDLVTFSRDCGGTPANIQAALVPPNEQVPFDAASFFSAAAEADLRPEWIAADAIELTAPSGAEILRQDPSVAGVRVTYR
jgi:hypothetical protein